MHREDTEVLVIGAGGAGMYAAIAAADAGRDVALVDKSLIGRGGATVMAQMTVAAAIGHQVPDSPEFHFRDTVAGGRGLCRESLAEVLCEEAPARILEMDRWRVGWARRDGRIKQVQAPGHDRPRCVYVDFLATGPAVAGTLRRRVNRRHRVRRLSDLAITDLVVSDGRALGAVGIHLAGGEEVGIAAHSVVVATGGLTRLFERNSGSANMNGDGHALALRAGAELVDMEFVQFFPIGHLAPRMIGLDPILWDPFRYKLGGRLLNGRMEEFTERYGVVEDGRYVIPRDTAAHAILKEVEAGRGSPAGGVYLSFRHIPAEKLDAAFGPIIGKLAANGIDLTRMAVEVAPIAHYQMGGIRVNTRMETRIEGLYAAGEVVGGLSGANRISGNGISEALVFGERAGRFAAARDAGNGAPAWDAAAAGRALERLKATGNGRSEAANTAAMVESLQRLMTAGVGPSRTADSVAGALDGIGALAGGMPPPPLGRVAPGDARIAEWLDLRNMLTTAEAVAAPALRRRESRGAHQRQDFPETDDAWRVNQIVRLSEGRIEVRRQPADGARGGSSP